MKERLFDFFARLHVVVGLIALFAATFWITDGALNQSPPLSGGKSSEQIAGPKPRMFIILIDSLRYETAIDPSLMPHLRQLAAEGVAARVNSAFTPITAASVRDIFTGRNNSAVLAWVINFAKVGGATESLFAQTTKAGLSSAVYSRWMIFDQFGPVITFPRPIPTTSKPPEETAQAAQALSCFLNGEADIVLAHIDTTDKVGHEFGSINTPMYAETFRRADAFVGEARRRLPAGATLVVLGDHGHDAQGRHTVGMSVPTYALYYGPAFRSGVTLAPLRLQTHRWLMSQALGLEVDAAHYDGAVVPDALRADLGRVASNWWARRGIRARGTAVSWSVWLYLSVVASLFLLVSMREKSPLDVHGWRAGLPWVALLPIVLVPDWQIPAGILAATFVMVVWAWGRPWRGWLPWLAGPIVAGLGFHVWGRLLGAWRPAVELWPDWMRSAAWIIVVIAGAMVSTESRRTWLFGGLFGALVFFGWPVNDRLGFPAMFAPLVACWWIWWVSARVRARALRAPGGGWDGPALGRLAGIGAGLFLCLQPLARPEIIFGDFDHWTPLIAPWSSRTMGYMVALAWSVKVLIFMPVWRGWAHCLLVATIGAVVVALEWGGWRFSTATWLAVLGGCFTLWMAALRWWPAGARMLGLAWLFLAYRYFTWPEFPHQMHVTTLMLGALTLCARARRMLAPARDETLPADRLALAALGLLAVGWATCLWSARHLDWEFAIAWVGVSWLELHAWVFGPLIAFKNVLPWLAFAWVLRDELGGGTPGPHRALWLALVAKFCAALLVNTGLAMTDFTGGQYYLAAQLSLVLALLLFCQIVQPGAWPRTVTRSTA